MKIMLSTFLGFFTDRSAGNVGRGAALREAIDRAGVEPLSLTQAEFAAYLKSEAERWGPVIRDKNIKSD